MGQELKRRAGISRRRFLIAGTAGTASLALGLRCLQPGDTEALAGSSVAPAPPPYGDWRDVYQERWRWDKVVRSSHFVNCWYQAHCAWNVYVKDGMVWREEQVADYPQTNASVPDPNPRGCQKGACFSERMYDPGRVRHPLKRVGPRGSGRWKRISWEQATDEVADAMLDTIEQDGCDRVIWELGPLYTEGTMTAGHQRLSVLMDSTNLDMNTEIGDGHRGAAETFGKISFERSADDYFYSDLILIWGSNPLYTQIPNAHYLTEARYKGARLVCIAPDYSASSIHADFFVPVKPGTDAALGLSVAQVLVEEELIDRDFLAEQTDLPMLVRDDTRRLLRTADLEGSGSDEELYFWDRERGAVAAPRRSLRLDGLEPELEGRFEVTLKDGSRVGVSTVFSLLRERLAGFRPEDASKICGTPPALIRKLALQLGQAKSAAMVTTSNMAKYYHGNLMERVQALVFALTGNYGKKGSGFVGFPWLDHDSIEPFVRDMFSLSDMMNTTALKVIGGMVVDTARMKLEGYSEEMIVHEHSRGVISEGRMTSGAMFWYVHGGLLEGSEKLEQWDPYLKRPVREVLDESLEKEWQYVWPKPGNDPKMMLVMGSNPLRRIRNYPRILEHLWPKLHTVVTLDFRMTSTALQSDYVLPAAGWYERSEHKWATPLMPYIHSGEKATSYYEAKSDWEIISRLAMAVDERAKARGMESFVDRRGDERPLHNLYDKYSQGGRFGPTDDEEVCADLLDKATNLGGLKWPELKKKGFARFEGIGKSPGSIGNATSIRPGETITPLTNHVFDKVPYPTLSRRMQFYLDQELYLEMGEELPMHKDPPMAGGDYPLMLTGGHARWSIHASWRDDKLMLQQQRGEPVVIIGLEDAVDRRIRDGAQVRVFNDLDEFQIMAKVTPGVRKGQLIVYHAWENFQFKNGKGFQNLIPSPLNPVELAGGQYHLRPMVIALQPSHTDRDTRVEVEPL
ncbi:MAG: molybdopterin-dependent oxidoreductase [Deltaproteobacteria bacterium]|nr:molybdopterin-dependent oxidoreductase [Deltaproteobacteria bacterium]